MKVTRLGDGQIALIYKGNPKCPRTIAFNFSGAIVNFADVYISSDLDSLKNANAKANNAGNNSLDAGVGLFNQGNGSFETLSPFVLLNVTKDIYARYDAQSGRAFVDLQVEVF